MERITVSVQDAGAMLGISARQVQIFIEQNILRSRKIGRRRLILVDDLRKFVGSDQPEPQRNK